MNLKERGITVGDLLILLIIILTTSILVKSFDKDKKKSFDNSNQVKYLMVDLSIKNSFKQLI